MGYFPYQLVSDLFFNINSRTHRILTLDSTFEVVFHSLPFSWLQRCVCGLGTPPKNGLNVAARIPFGPVTVTPPRKLKSSGNPLQPPFEKCKTKWLSPNSTPLLWCCFALGKPCGWWTTWRRQGTEKKIIKPGSKHRWFCLETLDAPKLILHAETALAGFVGFLSDTLWLESLKT